ncbi:MAG: M20/M25/M40 family metallo-hydrolase [candidate division WOR-3 bacterium]|nr:M20/M25/M40 family metallo-hydrolase [candidate division WOR-3 bacterium]MDW8150686.1 M20/M25/M40 family metallo-hydrolase [candidate division WOR-3 bacterium]
MDFKLLEKLSNAFGPSGFEIEVKEIIRSELGDDIYEDTYGNLIFYKKGKSSSKKILIECHIDEIGFIVASKSKGFIKLSPLGSWDAKILPSHLVKIKTKEDFVYGVFSTIPPHLENYKIELDSVFSLFVDVVENYEKVNIGDFALIDYSYREISENIIMGKAFDNRIGTFIAIELIKNVNNYFDTYFCFCVEEEVGMRGAKAILEHINVDLAIVIETTSAESPYIKEEEQSSFLSKGPCITIADKSFIVKPHILKEFIFHFEKYKIPFQVKRPMIGSTDAGILHQKFPTIVISVPCRYIHTPLQIAHKKDIELTFNFLKNYLENR